MNTPENTRQVGINPQTLSDYARDARSMGDEEIESEILVMEKASYLGKFSRERAEILKSEQSRRWRNRRGEGRAAA